jgi:hypothetical protein
MVAEIIILIILNHKQFRYFKLYRTTLYKTDFCLAKDTNGSFIPRINVKVTKQLVRINNYYKNGEVVPI